MTRPDPAWLAEQRWFRSKQRPIETVADVDGATIGPAELRIWEVAYRDGGSRDRYLVPLVDGHEPRDGDGAWTALVEAMAAGVDLEGRTGIFVCRSTAALDRLREHEPVERRLAVEQSNTSVRLGERIILKLYRLLEPGLSPDLEISVRLTAVGFADTPAVAGSMTWAGHDGAEAAAAMLQAFVPSRGDAWGAMLATIADDPGGGVAVARRIGILTAALHDALAVEGDPAFPARPATTAETAGWRASAERQLAGGIGALSGHDHDRMVAIAPAVQATFADAFGSATGEARVTRIHGDYHLGQLLARDDGRFSVIDFEGEPARPLDERRAPTSPLRDVAGMLRSLDYAARTAEQNAPRFGADAWLAEARAAFIDGYGGVDGSDAHLLRAFELEKACYEVRYEAGNRPAWLWLPLAAVGRLVAA